MPLPVIVLSLEDAHDRRAALVQTLHAQEIPFEIWHAVDGRKGLAPEYEQMIDRRATEQNLGRQMGNAEYGCALSHQQIYRVILDRDLAAAVILEDDAIPSPHLFEFIEAGQMPDCDLLLLDHGGARVSRRDRFAFGGVTAYRCKNAPYLTTGYAITRAGAAALVAAGTPLAGLADWPMDISTLRSYAVLPRIVDHPAEENSASDIKQDRDQHVRPRRYKRNDPRRFLEKDYWQRTWHKRFGKWIS
jgi:glycosyl transferase family 25